MDLLGGLAHPLKAAEKSNRCAGGRPKHVCRVVQPNFEGFRTREAEGEFLSLATGGSPRVQRPAAV